MVLKRNVANEMFFQVKGFSVISTWHDGMKDMALNFNEKNKFFF